MPSQLGRKGTKTPSLESLPPMVGDGAGDGTTLMDTYREPGNPRFLSQPMAPLLEPVGATHNDFGTQRLRPDINVVMDASMTQTYDTTTASADVARVDR